MSRRLFLFGCHVIVTDEHSEFAYIDWIRARTASHPAVPLGIGDDAAWLRLSPPGECLVTVDMLMEGVDFRFPDADPQMVGRKALAVCLSDIAAMAGRPLAAFVSLALPKTGGRQLAEALHAGIEMLAGEFNVAIAGGDIDSLGRPAGTERHAARTAPDWERPGSSSPRKRGPATGSWSREISAAASAANTFRLSRTSPEFVPLPCIRPSGCTR